ncbi:MAG: M23 family metallopeptidase [Nocardioides sp.]|nr:M23 family metallopeptidase [Nocardioides sp.]
MPHRSTARHPLPRRLRLPGPVLTLFLVALVAGFPAVVATSPAASAGSASWPLAPRPEVLSRFDPPSSTWAAGHRGVDLLGTPGQPVRAALGGTVAYAGLLAGKGVVVVRHGSTRTTYEPVDAVVDVGATVAPGEVLGHLNPAGSHCLPRTCLHWGLIEDTLGGDAYRDPLSLVGGGPIRLLPWAGLGTTSSPASTPGGTDTTTGTAGSGARVGLAVGLA